jgi:hypothetical protein
MVLTPRIWQPLAVALLACHGPVPSTTQPRRCEPNVPSSAQHPIVSRISTLAGDYDLIQVHTQPDGGKVTTGRLHLMPLDSAARAGAVGGAARDLIGWLDLDDGESAWQYDVGSRDINHPGVVLVGDHLRLGRARLGEYSEQLRITAVSPEGFWGWWKAEPGLEVPTPSAGNRVPPDPAGFFCALRATRER